MKRTDLADALPDYVMGALSADEQRAIDAQVADSPTLRHEVDRLTESLALTTLGLPTATPTPGLRERLLRTLGGVDRFAPFFDDLVQLFELPIESMKRLLARIDGTTWEHSLLGTQLEGAELFHFQVGPQLGAGGAAGGVVRIRAGGHFPSHGHLGREVTYVLEGGYCADGRVYGPGTRLEVPTETQHDYFATADRDLVLMVLHHGIKMLEQ